ncbi:MAG: hypothetical protein U0X39_02710 [Bacteroidales bacterium]
MNENRIMEQVGTVFGAFMTLFYLGVGFYLLMANNLFYVEKFFRYLIGGTFIFYGLYRGYRTVIKVRELFFTKSNEEDEE